MESAERVNVRATVSMSLFFTIMLLFITAVGIQSIELAINPKMLASSEPNPKTQSQNFFVELFHIMTFFHVVAGFLFAGLSTVHIIKNWKVLKSYFKKK